VKVLHHNSVPPSAVNTNSLSCRSRCLRRMRTARVGRGDVQGAPSSVRSPGSSPSRCRIDVDAEFPGLTQTALGQPDFPELHGRQEHGRASSDAAVLLGRCLCSAQRRRPTKPTLIGDTDYNHPEPQLLGVDRRRAHCRAPERVTADNQSSPALPVPEQCSGTGQPSSDQLVRVEADLAEGTGQSSEADRRTSGPGSEADEGRPGAHFDDGTVDEHVYRPWRVVDDGLGPVRRDSHCPPLVTDFDR
jgi:hypothetical protein